MVAQSRSAPSSQALATAWRPDYAVPRSRRFCPASPAVFFRISGVRGEWLCGSFGSGCCGGRMDCGGACGVRSALVGSGWRPNTTWINNAVSATTKRMCMNPYRVCEVATPTSQSDDRTPKIAQSIRCTPFKTSKTPVAGRDPPLPGPPFAKQLRFQNFWGRGEDAKPNYLSASGIPPWGYVQISLGRWRR